MIRTKRLRLVPASIELLNAELDGRETFAGLLGAAVPDDWPPELYDRAATKFTLDRLKKNPDESDWRLYYIILEQQADPVTVGTSGYKGPPDAEGAVELGYGVLPAFQRRGIATEATIGLISNAFSHAQVQRVISETLPELTASIGVMEKCGFKFIGSGSEEGVIRYELTRNEYENIYGQDR